MGGHETVGGVSYRARQWICQKPGVWLCILVVAGLVLALANLWLCFFRRNGGRARVQDAEDTLGEQMRGVADLRRALSFGLALEHPEGSRERTALRDSAASRHPADEASRQRLCQSIVHSPRPAHDYPDYHLF